MLGGNEELDNYVLKAEGIGRITLNVIGFVGVFLLARYSLLGSFAILGLFIPLGKRKHAWAYFTVFSIHFFLTISFIEKSYNSQYYFIPAMLIYTVAWVHANVVLSRYISATSQRISEIELQSETGIDTVLEKGLLHKVLGKSQATVDVLTGALQLPGGDPILLSRAGLAMTANKRHREAAEFYDRALASTKDEALIKQIKRTRRSATVNKLLWVVICLFLLFGVWRVIYVCLFLVVIRWFYLRYR